MQIKISRNEGYVNMDHCAKSNTSSYFYCPYFVFAAPKLGVWHCCRIWRGQVKLEKISLLLELTFKSYRGKYIRLFHMEMKEEKEIDSDCVCSQRWFLRKKMFQPNPGW